jgi:FkbM family methyltransferase
MSKYAYYLRSIPTLLWGFRKPWRILGIFLGLMGQLPSEVELRKTGWFFAVRSAMDVWIIKETCIDEGYLKGIRIESNWSVIDVGAGLGDFTILAASAASLGLVHAYEPFEESHQLLKRNLSLNHIDGVTCFQEAAGRSGTRLSAADSSKEAVSTAFAETSEPSSVPSINLRQMLARLPSGSCDLLKIDCEGCEYELLLSAEADSLRRIQRITMEAHDGYGGHATTDIVAHLQQNGFRVRIVPNPVHQLLSNIYAVR